MAGSVSAFASALRYVTGMVTRIRKGGRGHLYIKEWQRHFELSAETMAERLDIARESYYRLLREPKRIDTGRLQQLADAMGHDMTPVDFYRTPDRPSLDAMLDKAPPALRETAIDIVKRLLGKAS